MAAAETTLDLDKARALEAELDPEMHFRALKPPASWLVAGMLVALGFFHYYTAGFGILAHHWHVGIHLAFVLGLIFIVFPFSQRGQATATDASRWNPGGIPLYDWLCFALTVACVLYIPLSFADIAFRIGNPNQADVILGSIMIVLTLEATRRSMGWGLPVVVICFMIYGLWGNYAPGPLLHPGVKWGQLVDHLYMTSEGMFGLPALVIATYVFHFVLFGVIATRIGLGQTFIDIAQIIAGRFIGGPAKVSVLASAMFGMISGSSIANAVTVGSLTIPAMKRVGYKPTFAAAVEAAASAGGQITPPIMGAAAFLMVEFLEVPYRDIILAAIIPASMHFLGVMAQVHFEAKKLGLRGLRADEIPTFRKVMREGWPTLIPLVLLVGTIMSGYTPYRAAFVGITACIVIGFLNPRRRLTVADLIDALAVGSKYALAVGAAAAAVGIVVGVVTLSGAAFKVSFVVTTLAADMAKSLLAWLPADLFTLQGVTLFFTLIFIAIACVLLGAGLPTTATYIVLVAIVAPALKQLGVPPLASHFFIFFYGVLADITPPVAVAAYAAAAIAGANPYHTGNQAFRLGLAKALVPFVFVYSPSLLLTVQGHFSWEELIVNTTTCAIGVVLLGAAVTGYMLRAMNWPERILGIVASVVLIAPGNRAAILGLVLGAITLAIQVQKARRTETAPLSHSNR